MNLEKADETEIQRNVYKVTQTQVAAARLQRALKLSLNEEIEPWVDAVASVDCGDGPMPLLDAWNEHVQIMRRNQPRRRLFFRRFW